MSECVCMGGCLPGSVSVWTYPCVPRRVGVSVSVCLSGCACVCVCVCECERECVGEGERQ